MKTSARDDYLRRIDRAVALVQAAVDAGDELPALPQLAAAAHMSTFHFHRIYRALTGETVGATAGRLRPRHAGPYEKLHEFTDHFIGDWWAASGYALREELPFRHFLDDPEEEPEALLRADVYLPIAPADELQLEDSAHGS